MEVHLVFVWAFEKCCHIGREFLNELGCGVSEPLAGRERPPHAAFLPGLVPLRVQLWLWLHCGVSLKTFAAEPVQSTLRSFLLFFCKVGFFFPSAFLIKFLEKCSGQHLRLRIDRNKSVLLVWLALEFSLVSTPDTVYLESNPSAGPYLKF